MTEPQSPERETVEFFHGLASALAMTAQHGGIIPLMELPPREPGAGPAARRAQVRAEVEALGRELAAELSRKTSPPRGQPVATAGRILVSRGERIDHEARTYAPGAGLDVLIGALVADAEVKKEKNGR